ncbi:hypothetical protein LAZ67_20000406 [Cordylochernes scorpioides]|uniref:Uncharacterized protein n=1 Tax=Cordylochernes scorpioides TaxID=51811 RepID=A0ABY6LJ84_9ARAC|nr:hypothetical protein LAZ67_20000406 [Cordylochernes scorpioides]
MMKITLKPFVVPLKDISFCVSTSKEKYIKAFVAFHKRWQNCTLEPNCSAGMEYAMSQNKSPAEPSVQNLFGKIEPEDYSFVTFCARSKYILPRERKEAKPGGVKTSLSFEEQAMTLSELDLMKKIHALQHMDKLYKDYDTSIVNFDAGGWNNLFRPEFCQPVLRQVHDAVLGRDLTKARSAAASFDQCCYIEYYADFSPVQYIKTPGKGAVFQLMKSLARFCSGWRAPRRRRIGPHHREFPPQMIRIFPIAIRDEDVVATLWPYCRVVSLTHEVVTSGGYTRTTGNREAFIFLNEGLKLHQLPVKLVIVSIGESTTAYITYGQMPPLKKWASHLPHGNQWRTPSRHTAGPGVEASLLKAHSLQQLCPSYISRGAKYAHQAGPLTPSSPAASSPGTNIPFHPQETPTPSLLFQRRTPAGCCHDQRPRPLLSQRRLLKKKSKT